MASQNGSSPDENAGQQDGKTVAAYSTVASPKTWNILGESRAEHVYSDELTSFMIPHIANSD
jgi:hypothetical protein